MGWVGLTNMDPCPSLGHVTLSTPPFAGNLSCACYTTHNDQYTHQIWNDDSMAHSKGMKEDPKLKTQLKTQNLTEGWFEVVKVTQGRPQCRRSMQCIRLCSRSLATTEGWDTDVFRHSELIVESRTCFLSHVQLASRWGDHHWNFNKKFGNRKVSTENYWSPWGTNCVFFVWWQVLLC